MDDSVIIIGFVVSIISAFITMAIYSSKRRSIWSGFALGFCLGIIGIIIALFIPSRLEGTSYAERVASGEMKVCPHCGNVILSTVVNCPKCGNDVSRVVPRVADLALMTTTAPPVKLSKWVYIVVAILFVALICILLGIYLWFAPVTLWESIFELFSTLVR